MEALLRGDLILRLKDSHGKIIREDVYRNLIVDLGLSNMVKLLGGDPSGTPITQIGIGTSNTPASNSDTTLASLFKKALNTGGTSNVFTTNTVTYGYQIATTEANGLTIQEVGLFNSGNVLIARKVLDTPIVKTSAFAVEGTWVLTVNR